MEGYFWLAPLAALVLLAWVLHARGGVEAALAPFSACALVMLALLATGFCNLLAPARILLFVVALAAGLWTARQKPRQFAAFLLSPGVLAFLAGSIVLGCIYTANGSFYTQWDEFSHWGPFYRQIFENGRLHIWSDWGMFHASYPQATQVFYAFTALLSPRFSEADTFVSLGILMNASSAALLCRAGWKTPVRSALLAVACPLFFSIFPLAWPYYTVYQDAVLGALFGAALVCAVSVRAPAAAQVLPAALGAAVLTQVKANGFLFAMICLAVLAAALLFCPREGQKTTLRTALKNGKAWRYFGAAAVPALAYQLVWKVLLRITGNAADQFSQNQRESFFAQIQGWLKGENDFVSSVFERFQINFGQLGVVFNGYGTPLAAALILTVAALVFGIWLWRKKREYGVCLALCAMPVFLAAYLFTLIYTYLCYMNDLEALLNASSDRYLSTFYIGWVMVTLAAVLQYGADFLPRRLLPALAAAAVLMMELRFGLQHDVLNLTLTRAQAGRDGFDSVSAQMAQGLTAQDNIWVIAADDRIYMYMYHYTMLPAQVSMTLPSAPEATLDLWQTARDNGVEYLLVYVADDAFVSAYQAQFSDGLTWVTGKGLPCLYRVAENKTFQLCVQTVLE